MKIAACLLFMLLPALAAAAAKSESKKFLKIGGPTAGVKVCFPKQHLDILNALVYVARDQGFFKEAGLDVSIDTLLFRFHENKGPSGNFQVETAAQSRNGWGKVCHFSSLSAGGAIALLPGRIEDYRPLLLSEFKSGNDLDLVVAGKSPIKSLKDLKGKKVRVANVAALIGLSDVMKAQGMSLMDILIRRGNSQEISMASLIEGKHDATFIVPTLRPLYEDSGTVRVLERNVVSQGSASLPAMLLVADSIYAATNPNEVIKFLAAVKRAQEYVQHHPDAMLESVRGALAPVRRKGLPVESSELADKAAAVPMPILDLRDPAQVKKAKTMMKAFYDKMFGMRFVSRPYPLDNWFGTNFVER